MATRSASELSWSGCALNLITNGDFFFLQDE